MKNITGYDLSDLQSFCKENDVPLFRAKQIFHWMYHHGVRSFNEMSNIPKSVKKILEDNSLIDRPKLTSLQKSEDGTQKWLMNLYDNNEVESVFIPEKTRGTLCISSQVGCTLTCKFCHTGTQRLVRNLTPGEILDQIMVARDLFDEWPTPQEKSHVTNIVMMGMGEPLFNYENVKKAVLLLMNQEGLGFSKHKITLSTSGVLPYFESCARDLGINLAVSLHATTDDVRSKIMPINNKYPIKDLIYECEKYAEITNGKKITFEYVMLDHVNDSTDDAKRLIKLIKGIPSKINLIPFNKWPGTEFSSSSSNRIKKFAEIMEDAGYKSPIRRPRGDDILAACGQLKSSSKRQCKNRAAA